MNKYLLIVCLVFFVGAPVLAQPVPAEDENIPHLVTFGNKAATSWGDNDFCQIFFFLIPDDFEDPVYIKVYDPDCGGQIDEINGYFDTKTEYSVYGGKGCWSNEDAQKGTPVGQYKSGTLLASKIFGNDPEYDGKWYVFGPFNPKEGEPVPELGGHVFKIITEGVDGDDGNLYRYFLSTDSKFNVKVEGGNAFTYEYTFRMWNNAENVSHIYPFIDKGTVSVRQANFDWDSDGEIRVVSISRSGQLLKISGEDVWEDKNEFKIFPEEVGKSLDFQFIKKKYPVVINNNVVVRVKNQYGENMKFFTIPIGGVPKYSYSIGAKKVQK